jgi:hypothetical protein
MAGRIQTCRGSVRVHLGGALGAAATTGLALCALALMAVPASAAFPGANGSIVFDSNRDVGAADLYTVTPGGTVARFTTSNGSSDPVYSPDGSRIAFISTNPGGAYQVFLINADGSGRTQLTTNSAPKQEPAWSPDGSQVAFVANSLDSDGQTDLEIWAINVDGTGLRQLTNNTVADTYPAWSPLGDKIAFVSSADVYVMNSSDGGGRTNLTPDSPPGCSPTCYQGGDSDPAWSPNGTRIAYVHGNTFSGGGLPDIWTMDPDGANKANLSNNDAVSFTQPVWSPQGDQLALVGTAAGTTNRDIWLMNADGTGQTAIDTNPAFDSSPDWGPPAPAPPPDTNAPDLGVSGKKSQRLGKAVAVTSTCDEACTVLATGKLTIGKAKVKRGGAARAGKLKLKPAQASLAAGETAKLKLKLKGKSRKLAERALKRNAKVTAKLKLVATDAAGNDSTATRSVKLKL